MPKNDSINGTLLSDYLGIDYQEFEKRGIFDPTIDQDSEFYINILRLKHTQVAEFAQSYQRINQRFTEIAKILSVAKTPNFGDTLFRRAVNLFIFPEVNGINLGVAKESTGAGIGPILAKKIVTDAYAIVQAGCTDPEFFHLLPLFEDDIGPDRISDMIANLVLCDIKTYTQNMYRDLEITQDKYPKATFKNGFLVNPYKQHPIYLVPEDILHELPIAKSWEEIDCAVSKNNAIRAEINEQVDETWSRWAANEKKALIRRKVFGDPDACKRVLDAYRDAQVDEIDYTDDIEYFFAKLWQQIRSVLHAEKSHESEIDSETGAVEIVEMFKDWVENNRGWAILQEMESRNREKGAQRIIHACAKYYLKINNLDISCEANEGPGPVDFKLSRGNDKTVVELKLSSNDQYEHGYTSQVERYAQAEETEKRVYVLVNVGNHVRVNRLKKLHQQNLDEEKAAPKLIIIDSTEQKSASKG